MVARQASKRSVRAALPSTPPAGRLAGFFAPVDCASIVVFRILFGLLMLWDLGFYLFDGRAQLLYLDPTFRFHYPGFAWVQPLPTGLMWALFLALAACAAGIAAGQRYRIACAGFVIGSLYLFLLDAANYNNHTYLILVLALVLWIVPAHRRASFDARRDVAIGRDAVPAWCLLLLRFQIAMPYVFGGLAKLNSDWLLRAEPMKYWLATGAAGGALARPWHDEAWFAFLVCWGGMLFDLLIVPALLWRPTRKLAFCLAAVFHVANAFLFNIGVFPWLMIAANTLFFDPDWARRAPGLRRLFQPQRPRAQAAPEHAPRWLGAVLLGWVALQLVLPLRHFLYPGNVDWTEQGHRFAWRMKIRDKTGEIRFLAVDRASQQAVVLEDARTFLTPMQWSMMVHDPELLRQFAVSLRDDLEESTGRRYEIHVEANLSLNARPPSLLIDPSVDLASVRPRVGGAKGWILPLPSTAPSA